MRELWKNITGYEGMYKISNFGRVKSYKKRTGKGVIFLTTFLFSGSTIKYLIVHLSKNNNKKNCAIHRLVAQAFIPNPENKPQVNHLNNNPLNNHVDNLVWGTPSENMRHCVKQNRCNKPKGETHHFHKLKVKEVLTIRSLRKNGSTYRELAETFRVGKRHIVNIVNKTSWEYL
jgi:hypothetical protein